MHISPCTPGRVRELRERAGFSQFDLALRAGIAVATAQRFDAGLLPRRSTETLARVADALGVTEDELRGQAGH